MCVEMGDEVCILYDDPDNSNLLETSFSGRQKTFPTSVEKTGTKECLRQLEGPARLRVFLRWGFYGDVCGFQLGILRLGESKIRSSVISSRSRVN